MTTDRLITALAVAGWTLVIVGETLFAVAWWRR